MTDRTEELTRASQPAVPQDGSYMDWPAIFAGAVVASAIAFVFTTFGAGLGLSLISPYQGEGSATAAIVATGLWMLWTTVSSFMVGGYIAGRMRRRVDGATADEVDIRDGIHGVTVWGVGALIGAVLAGSAVGSAAKVTESAVSGAASAASTVTSAAGNVAGTVAGAAGDVIGSAASVAGDALGGAAEMAGSAASEASGMLPSSGFAANPFDYAASVFFRTDGSAPSTQLVRAKNEAQSILSTVVRTGEIPQQDVEYLYTLVASNTDLTEEEVKARVDEGVEAVQTARAEAVEAAETARQEAMEMAETARQEAMQAAEEAEQAARDAADAARVYSLISAFALAAALLIAAAAAYWAASMGGRHRDEGKTFEAFGRWN